MSYAHCVDPGHPEGAHSHEGARERVRRTPQRREPPLVLFWRAPEGHYRHGDHKDPRDINGPWFCCASVLLGLISLDDCGLCGDPWPCAWVPKGGG